MSVVSQTLAILFFLDVFMLQKNILVLLLILSMIVLAFFLELLVSFLALELRASGFLVLLVLTLLLLG